MVRCVRVEPLTERNLLRPKASYFRFLLLPVVKHMKKDQNKKEKEKEKERIKKKGKFNSGNCLQAGNGSSIQK